MVALAAIVAVAFGIASGIMQNAGIAVTPYVQISEPTHPVLWIAIKNQESHPLIVCRAATFVSVVPSDSTKVAFGDSKLDPGCGTDGFDPWWVVSAGETRMESYELAEAIERDAELDVSVDLLVKAGPQSPIQRIHAEAATTTVRKAIEAWNGMWRAK